MGRHVEPKQTPAEAGEILSVSEAGIVAAQDALVVQGAAVKALAVMLGYEGGISPDALENSAREAIRRMNMAVLEVGAYLLLLREQCPHGEFLNSLDRLDLQPRVAQQYMQVTLRFGNANSNSHLKTIGKTKMLEMLVLDDQEIVELAEGGNVRGLTMDKVDGMSVKELRAALREASAEGKANQAILDKKNSTIDRLEREKKRIQAAPPNEVLADLQREATAIMNDALGAVRGGMRQALIALQAHGDGDHSLFMAGLVGQVQADLAALREEFHLPDVSNAADAQLAAEVAEWSGASKTAA